MNTRYHYLWFEIPGPQRLNFLVDTMVPTLEQTPDLLSWYVDPYKTPEDASLTFGDALILTTNSTSDLREALRTKMVPMLDQLGGQWIESLPMPAEDYLIHRFGSMDVYRHHQRFSALDTKIFLELAKGRQNKFSMTERLSLSLNLSQFYLDLMEVRGHNRTSSIEEFLVFLSKGWPDPKEWLRRIGESAQQMSPPEIFKRIKNFGPDLSEVLSKYKSEALAMFDELPSLYPAAARKSFGFMVLHCYIHLSIKRIGVGISAEGALYTLMTRIEREISDSLK